MEISGSVSGEMMQQISVESQIEKIVGGINALSEQVAQASVRALNRTAEWMNGQVSKELSAEKRLKLKLIRDRIAMFLISEFSITVDVCTARFSRSKTVSEVSPTLSSRSTTSSSIFVNAVHILSRSSRTT
jgi:hypothetical protein